MAIAGVAWLPTDYFRTLTLGTDSYETHHRLFGQRTQSQTVSLRHDIRGTGALLVLLRPGERRGAVVVTAWSNAQEKLATSTITADQLVDDTITWVRFDRTIPREYGEVRLEFAAPEATAQHPIGLRFDQAADGQLAVGVIERIPVWQQWTYWQADHAAAADRLVHSLWGGLIAVALLYFFPQHGRPARWAWVAGLLLLLVIAIGVRLPLLKSIESVYGGDAYNYIFKSYAWVNGEDPFAADVRKAPLYSLLLLPGLLTDPILWGRMVNVVAASIAVLLVAILLRRLKLPPALALLGGLLLAINRDFRWESVHGLANVVYATLIVAALLALTYSQRARGAYVVGVLCGAITLTRYEGGIVGAILLPATWLYHRLRPAWIVYTLLPTILLVALPFVLWPLTGQLGVRPPSDIVADGGLSVAYSLDDFLNNLKNFKQIFGRTWLFAPGTGNQFRFFIVGTALGVALETIYALFPRAVKRWRQYGVLLLGLWLLVILLRDKGPVLEQLVLQLSAMTGVGMVMLCARQPRIALPMLLVVVLQIMVVTAILPKPRYYLQIIPCLSIALIAAVAALSSWRTRLLRAASLFFLGMVVALVYVDGNDALGGYISDYNSRSQDNTVMLRAARSLRGQPGLVALATDDLSMRIMLGDTTIKVWNPNLFPSATPEEQLRWLRESPPNFLVESSANPLFTVTSSYAEYFEHQATFTTDYGPAQAQVWRVKLPATGN